MDKTLRSCIIFILMLSSLLIGIGFFTPAIRSNCYNFNYSVGYDSYGFPQEKGTIRQFYMDTWYIINTNLSVSVQIDDGEMQFLMHEQERDVIYHREFIMDEWFEEDYWDGTDWPTLEYCFSRYQTGWAYFFWAIAGVFLFIYLLPYAQVEELLNDFGERMGKRPIKRG